MMSLSTFVMVHWGMLVVLFVVASVVATAFDAIAKAIAPEWPKAAHVFAAIARVMPQVLAALAHLISMLAGRPFIVAGATPEASPQTAAAPGTQR